VSGAYYYDFEQIDKDWFLTAVLSPATPVYEAYPQALGALNALPTLQQRVGNRYWDLPQYGASSHGLETGSSEDYQTGKQRAIWGRMEGTRSHIEPKYSSTNSQYDVDYWKMQAGLDGMWNETDSGKLLAGINAQYGKADTDIFSALGNGFIDTTGYGVGLTATWFGNSGFYFDGQAQHNWFDSNLSSGTLGSLAKDHKGSGRALSIEIGQRMNTGSGLIITPQAQLVYAALDFDTFTSANGAVVSLEKSSSLDLRVGVSAQHEFDWVNKDDVKKHASVHAIANLHHEFLDGTRVGVSGRQLSSELDAWSGEIGLGATLSPEGQNYALFGEVTTATGLENFADSYSFKGIIGLRASF
jgi:outer membrane autotransporter protein